MPRFYVFSTLTNDHVYTQWTRPSDPNMGPEIIPRPVLINGGANRATYPDGAQGRFTPRGVRTEVTEAQMEYLNGSTMFKRHLKKGFITVTTSKEESDLVARDMQKKDNSAPLTPTSPELNKPEGPHLSDDKGIVKTALDKLGEILS